MQSSRTSIISKSISWSTCMNFWSQSSISVLFLRASDSSSWAWGGSLRCHWHHSRTLRRTTSLTLYELAPGNVDLWPVVRQVGGGCTYVGDGNGRLFGRLGVRVTEKVRDKDRSLDHVAV